MNPLEKNTLLNKIEIEINALVELKNVAFIKAHQTQAIADHREWERLNAKMEGVFLVRHLILESECLEAYQERPDKRTNQQSA